MPTVEPQNRPRRGGVIGKSPLRLAAASAPTFPARQPNRHLDAEAGDRAGAVGLVDERPLGSQPGNVGGGPAPGDLIVDDQLWTPEDLEGARGLSAWGPPPPPFLHPDDLAAIMAGAHAPR